MKCSECNKEVRDDWKACPHCGTEIPEKHVCPECSKEIDPTWKVCPFCVANVVAVDVSKKKVQAVSKPVSDEEETRISLPSPGKWDVNEVDEKLNGEPVDALYEVLDNQNDYMPQVVEGVHKELEKRDSNHYHAYQKNLDRTWIFKPQRHHGDQNGVGTRLSGQLKAVWTPRKAFKLEGLYEASRKGTAGIAFVLSVVTAVILTAIESAGGVAVGPGFLVWCFILNKIRRRKLDVNLVEAEQISVARSSRTVSALLLVDDEKRWIKFKYKKDAPDLLLALKDLHEVRSGEIGNLDDKVSLSPEDLKESDSGIDGGDLSAPKVSNISLLGHACLIALSWALCSLALQLFLHRLIKSQSTSFEWIACFVVFVSWGLGGLLTGLVIKRLYLIRFTHVLTMGFLLGCVALAQVQALKYIPWFRGDDSRFYILTLFFRLLGGFFIALVIRSVIRRVTATKVIVIAMGWAVGLAVFTGVMALLASLDLNLALARQMVNIIATTTVGLIGGLLTLQQLRQRSSFVLFWLLFSLAVVVNIAPPFVAKIVRAEKLSQERICQDNRRQIKQAKAVFSIKESLARGAVINESQITVYIKNGFDSLECPAGGSYLLNPLDVDPTCSIHGLKLEKKPKKKAMHKKLKPGSLKSINKIEKFKSDTENVERVAREAGMIKPAEEIFQIQDIQISCGVHKAYPAEKRIGIKVTIPKGCYLLKDKFNVTGEGDLDLKPDKNTATRTRKSPLSKRPVEVYENVNFFTYTFTGDLPSPAIVEIKYQLANDDMSFLPKSRKLEVKPRDPETGSQRNEIDANGLSSKDLNKAHIATALPERRMDYIFVVDSSEWMTRQRMFYVGKAIVGCIANMGSKDRYRILSAGASVDKCFGRWASVKSTYDIEKAKVFLSNLEPVKAADVWKAIHYTTKLDLDIPIRPAVMIVVTKDLFSGSSRKINKTIEEFTEANQGHLAVYALVEEMSVFPKLAMRSRMAVCVNKEGRWGIPNMMKALVESSHRFSPVPPAVRRSRKVEFRWPTENDETSIKHEVVYLNGSRKLIIDANDMFAYDKANIKPSMYSRFESFAVWFKKNKRADIVVEMHADKKRKSSVRYNLKLSEKRAEAIRDYLILKYRINKTKIRAEGMGFKYPLVPVDERRGNLPNNRIEIHVEDG